MMTLNENSTPSLPPPKHSRLVVAMLIVAPIGFIDAAFLTVEHYLNRIPPCSSISGCEAVTTSVYSTVWGVPIALLGALYYLTIILGLVYYLDSKNKRVLHVVAGATVLGFVVSLGLVSLMLFVIHALCIYCVFSAASSTTLFILGMLVLRSSHYYGTNTKR